MRRIWRRLDEQHVVANGHQLATLHVRAESHRHLGDEVCANIWRRLQHCDKNAATSSRETNKQTKKKKKGSEQQAKKCHEPRASHEFLCNKYANTNDMKQTKRKTQLT